jgi:copper(I)-binding protein
MSRLIHRRRLLEAGLAASVGWAGPASRACEFFGANLRVFHPWSRATAPDATTGILCMTIDEVTAEDRLLGAQSPVAESVQMGGPGAGRDVDLLIPPGRETVLSEAGAHLLLVGLKHPLEMGRSYPLLLTFARSGAVISKLNVDYAFR